MEEWEVITYWISSIYYKNTSNENFSIKNLNQLIDIDIKIYWCEQREKKNMLIEQWKFLYKPTRYNSIFNNNEVASIYKKMILSIRSIYCYTHIMPSFRIIKQIKKKPISNSKFIIELKNNNNIKSSFKLPPNHNEFIVCFIIYKKLYSFFLV